MARHGGMVSGSGCLSMNQGWVDTGAGGGSVRNITSRDGKNVYAVLANTRAIAQFTRDPNSGKLTAMATPTVATYIDPSCISESPDGKTVFISNYGGDSVRAYSRNATTGALTQISGVNCGAKPMANMCAPDNNAHFYVVCRNPGSGTQSYIQRFARNTTDGTLANTPTDSLNLGVDIQSTGLAMTSDGKYAYVGNFGTGYVTCLTRNTGTGVLALNTVQQTASTGVTQAAWVAVSPDDKHLYVVCDSGKAIVGFAINAADGTLGAPITTVILGEGPWAIAIHPNGKHIYVAESDSQYVAQLSRDTTTGVLTLKSPARVRSDPYYLNQVLRGSAGPSGISCSPDGRHAYVNSALGNQALVTMHINNP